MANTDKDQPNFESLSTAEVTRLYRQTLEAARKQQGTQQAQSQALEDLGIDGPTWRDGFGNVIDGVKPAHKQVRTYVDAAGNIRELNDGEVAPEPQGSSVLEKITKFANEYCTDPEIATLLPVDETVFEVTLAESGWFLRGDMNRSGVWHIIAIHDDHDDFKFTLKDNLDRDAAIASASHHVRTLTDPEPRALTPVELRRVAIQAANATDVPTLADAVVSYLRLATGDDSISVDYLARPDRRNLIIEAIYFCWKNSYAAKGFVENEDLLGHIEAYVAGRDFVTIQTFNDAWSSFQTERSRGLGGWRLEQPEPQPLTPKQIEEMSDEEIEANLAEARRLHREGKLQD
jgi:hypothetical protein